MPYQDSWAICTKCGKQFVFRIEEQRRQVEQGEEVTPPPLCPSCRTSAHVSRPRAERRTAAPSAGPEPGPQEGTVKWYDAEKGYGFIVQPGGDEIFFHRTRLAPGESPHFPDGTRVTYIVEQTSKGPQAVGVAHMDPE